MSQDPLAGRELGPYRLIKRIGHGGMGMVYECIHTNLMVSYAVKILHPTLTADDTMVARLRREATFALQLQHENIVQVLDYGWDDELGFFLVMELLRGQDLGTLLQNEPILSVGRTASIVYPVCEALQLAHQRGIIHRDLKPGNVFLTPTSDGNYQIKLLDFGIARLLTPEGGQMTVLTRAGKSFGTPEYMPPEQIRAIRDKIGPATDIYGLCIVTFRMLTGYLPFRSKNLLDLMNQVMLQTPPMLSRYRPELGGTDLERLLFVCMSKNPGNRIQPMETFYAQFRAAIETDPLLAKVIQQEVDSLRQALQEREKETPTSPQATQGDTGSTDQHGFREGQTFVFGNEVFSFDGEKLRSSTRESGTGPWQGTAEQDMGMGPMTLTEGMAEMARGLLDSVEATKALPPGKLTPPPGASHELPFDPEETLQGTPDIVHEALLHAARQGASLDPFSSVMEKLHTMPEGGDLTLAPKMVHKRPGLPLPGVDLDTFSDGHVEAPTRTLLANSDGPDEAPPPELEAEGSTFEARLIRVIAGFLIGFFLIACAILISKKMGSNPASDGECCTLLIESMPTKAKVIGPGNQMLGYTPLRLQRDRSSSLHFVLVKPGHGLVAGSWKAQKNRKMKFELPRQKKRK